MYHQNMKFTINGVINNLNVFDDLGFEAMGD